MRTDYIKYEELFSQLSLPRGSTVYVISDVLKLMCVARENGERFDAQRFIDSLLSEVGPEGTVLFPTFSWAFCQGKGFHRRTTLSHTGGLSNIALKRPDFRRTQHPIYSFAVWGKLQDYYCAMQNVSAFGEDSPFQDFYDRDIINVCVGIDYKLSCTFVHYAEEMAKVDYRFLKEFRASYTEPDESTSERAYRMFVRREGVGATMLHPDNDAILAEKQAYRKFVINGVTVDCLRLKPTGDVWIEDLKNDRRLIYTNSDPNT